jgi:hypothetical protein
MYQNVVGMPSEKIAHRNPEVDIGPKISAMMRVSR